MKKNSFNNQGQTLVTLLVFAVVAIAITTTAVAVIINIARSASMVESRFIVSQAAESGVENAIIRLLRDPNYSGETLEVGDATAIITVVGSDPKTITSEAVFGGYSQTVQATITYIDNNLTITSWIPLY